jgi:beta-lactamase regulating signal transducer with metallopeptidase domain
MTLLPPTWPGSGDALATIAGLGLTFLLHATVLLLVVWMLERLGWLKEPAWAEWAWRVALFGAFASVVVEAVPQRALTDVASMQAHAGRVEANADVPATIAPQAMPADRDTASAADIVMPLLDKIARMPSPVRVAEAPFALRAPDALILSLLLLWALGSAILLLRVLRQSRGVLRLRARLLHDGEAPGAALHECLRALAFEMGVRMPVMRILPGLAGPLVLSGVILLPRWAEGLDPRQQRAMLAHELAHLRRRDPLWRPLQRLACVPLFFHPLAWTAVKRLEALAETLCDRSAAERSGGGRPLAECLAECLARSAANPHAPHRDAGWALAMAERDTGIVSRVKDLLENPQMTLSTIPARWRWVAAGIALFTLIALPGVLVIARPGTLPDVFGQRDLSITIRRDGDNHTVRSDLPGAGERFQLFMDGDVDFTAREDDIARMASDAEFVLLQERAGITRELKIIPTANGVKREYRVEGKAHAFDADAKAWLATAIPEIHRLTAIDADARIERMLAQGGVPRVLAEIDLIRSGYARATYIETLSRAAALADADMAGAIAATAKIDSDFEKRRAMSGLLAQARIAPVNQAALLVAAEGIDSNFERSEWLSSAAAKLPIDAGNTTPWQTALSGVDSDFERRRALQAMIEQGQPRAAAVSLALRSAKGMSNGFELRSLLQIAAKSHAMVADADYFAVVDAIDSDFERREALLALVKADAPDAARSRRVLDSVRDMGSDFERGEVLQALAKVMPNDPALIEAYRAATRAMASQHERGQAEQALDRFYRS